MNDQTEIFRLRELLDESNNIFITSHISPDPDAISSVILTGLCLKQNFPAKHISMVLEEKRDDLSFINGYEQISFQPINDALRAVKPDLFILLDGNNFERCSRFDGQHIRHYIAQNNVKTVIVDHHELAGKEQVDVFINNQSPSTAQDVYELLFKTLDLEKPPNAAHIAMVGFFADTGGFVYVKSGQQERIFSVAAELVADGADIEEVKNHLEAYSEDDLKAIGELATNLAHGADYSYSFLSDGFINWWASAGHDYSQLQRPTNTFLNNYIRNIDGRRWGFIVYRNKQQGDNYYSASFRSQGGTPDVSLIAAQLGGGGHKAAAGAKFEAGDVGGAIATVKQSLEKVS